MFGIGHVFTSDLSLTSAYQVCDHLGKGAEGFVYKVRKLSTNEE